MKKLKKYILIVCMFFILFVSLGATSTNCMPTTPPNNVSPTATPTSSSGCGCGL